MAYRKGTLGTEQGPCGWYVTMAVKTGKKAYIAGPFDTKQEALEARDGIAVKANRKRQESSYRGNADNSKKS